MTEDFQQKNRNRPIRITNVAISKVPRIKLEGFSEEENIFIKEQHKRLLTVAKEKNDSKEVGIKQWNISNEGIVEKL